MGPSHRRWAVYQSTQSSHLRLCDRDPGGLTTVPTMAGHRVNRSYKRSHEHETDVTVMGVCFIIYTSRMY